MNVLLYSVTKRPNSTKQPLPSEGANFSCQVKDECSFLNPVLKFSKDIVVGTFSPAAFNYCSIPYWQRYYYINDWEYKNGYWEASCSVDVLASFKYAIGATSAYIVRADSASNGAIIDTLYPAKTDVQITTVNVADSWYGVAPSGGCYLIGVINNLVGSRIGTLVYYALTAAQLNSLMEYLYSDGIFSASNITDITEGLWKSLFNPIQYIVSCMWFPFPPSYFGNTEASICIGYWDTEITAVYNVTMAAKTYMTATIPDHPQINRGSYLNHAPYTRITLYAPPFGAVPIDTDFLVKGKYLYSPVYIDFVSGLATLRVSLCQSSQSLADTNIICERNAQIGVPIQLNQLTPDYVNTVANIGNGISNVFTSNLFGAAASVMSAFEANMPTVSSVGMVGSTMETIQAPYIMVEHYKITDENKAEFGRPLCETRTISTLSGYVKCGEDDHQFNCTRSESDEINRFLRDGFFYE